MNLLSYQVPLSPLHQQASRLPLGTLPHTRHKPHTNSRPSHHLDQTRYWYSGPGKPSLLRHYFVHPDTHVHNVYIEYRHLDSPQCQDVTNRLLAAPALQTAANQYPAYPPNNLILNSRCKVNQLHQI